MDVRPYCEDDRQACLAVFDSNVPRFFHAAEREEFAAFLERLPGTYLVLEHDGNVVGCGGFAPEADPSLVSLTWGMVQADLHGNGLGRLLLLYRLREIGRIAGVERVRIATSQHTASFFEKQGFKPLSSVKDGFGPGIDRLEMVKRLTVCV